MSLHKAMESMVVLAGVVLILVLLSRISAILKEVCQWMPS